MIKEKAMGFAFQEAVLMPLILKTTQILKDCDEVSTLYWNTVSCDSEGAALYAATIRGRELGFSDAQVKEIIGI